MLPDFYGAILAARRHSSPIRGPIKGIHFVCVTGERLLGFLVVADLPQLRGGVLRRRHEVTAIAAPRDAVDGADVSSEGCHKVPVPSVPHLNLFVEGRAGKVAGVRAEGDGAHGLLVAGKALDGLLGLARVPVEEGEVVAAVRWQMLSSS